jgi:hypothetical protein
VSIVGLWEVAMGDDRVFVLVRSGRRPEASQAIMRWLRFLLPAAVLLSAPAGLPPDVENGDVVVISIDADEVASGPLALADAIARHRSRGGPPRG